MAKFAALLIAAIAFQVVFAGNVSDDQLNPHVRKAKKRLHTVTDEVVSVVQNIQPDEHQGKHAIAAIANDYSHELQDAVYHLNQAVQHNHPGHGQQVLVQVAQGLSNIAHQIQQVANADSAQVKSVVKTGVQNVATEVDKLVQVAHQLHQEAEKGEDNVHEEVEDVLYEILEATRELQVRAQLQQETHQQTKEHIQRVTNEVSTVIQSINSNDQKTAHQLAHLTHHISQVVSHVVDRLRVEAHHHQGETKNVIKQVSIKLIEIRASLDGVVDSHGQTNVQARINELKNQLKTNVHNIAAQVERLVQLAQGGNQSNQGDQDVNNLVKRIIAEVLAVEHVIHRQLEVVVGN